MRIDLGGLSLHVVLDGHHEAPALVLAHPLGGDLRVWDALAQALASKFFVIRYDARGHGGSDFPSGPYGLSDLGGDVLALMDALKVDKAHFLGLSMGGLTAQWLMLHAPDRLDKVVLANTAAHLPDFAGWNARIRAVRQGGVAALIPSLLPRWLSPAFQAAQPEKTAQVANTLRANNPGGYAACCSALRDADLREALRAAPARPVLVVVGDRDGSTPPEKGEALARSLPQAHLVRLPAAHLSCIEAPEAFRDAVAGFLI